LFDNFSVDIAVKKVELLCRIFNGFPVNRNSLLTLDTKNKNFFYG
jgi:hypothetical protein